MVHISNRMLSAPQPWIDPQGFGQGRDYQWSRSPQSGSGMMASYNPQPYIPPSLPGVSADDRKQAFYQGLLAFGPRLMAAGAPTTDPGGGQRMLAQAGGAFASDMGDYMKDIRGQNYLKYMMDRQTKTDAAAHELGQWKLHQRPMQEVAALANLRKTQLENQLNINREAAYQKILSPQAAVPVASPIQVMGDASGLGVQPVPQPVAQPVPQAPFMDAETHSLFAAMGSERGIPEVLKYRQSMKPTIERHQIVAKESEAQKSFMKETGSYRDQVSAYSRMEAIYRDPTSNTIGTEGVQLDEKAFKLDAPGAADLALIFNFMKMLDPRSVVRESEFAQAQKTANIPGRIWALYEGVAKGGKLGPPQRKMLMAQARNQYNMAAQNIQRYMESAKGRIRQYKSFGMDPERAITYSPYKPIFSRSAFSASNASNATTVETGDN